MTSPHQIKNRAYRVCLMGASLDTGNRGVSALAASLIKIIHETYPEAAITFLTSSRESKTHEIELSGKKVPVYFINYRLSPRARLSENLIWIFVMAVIWRIIPLRPVRDRIRGRIPCLKAIDSAAFVGNIRGGDSFSDIYGTTRFVIGSIPDIIVLLMGKRLILLPQTYGPYKSRTAKAIARFIMMRAHKILSRDREGAETVREILGRKGRGRIISFCPDVAFVLDSRKPKSLSVAPPLPVRGSSNDRLIGININGLMYNGGYNRDNMFGLSYDYKLFVNDLILELMRGTEARLILVPHTFGPPGNINSDPDACEMVLKSMDYAYRDRIHMVKGEYDQHEIKGIIGLCDFFIGSRMHACIAALSQGIPTVAVAYSKKFRGVFESVDSGHLVADGRTLDARSSIEMILSHFQNYRYQKNEVMGKMERVERGIMKAFQTFLPERTSSLQ